MSIIRHTGIVTDTKNEKISVRINDALTCHSCGLKNACGKHDEEPKFFEISVKENYSRGETVYLEMNSELGLKAMLLAFFFPFLVLIIVIMLSLQFFNELIASIIGVGFVSLYYWILQKNENLIEKKIHLNISKTTKE